MIRILKKDEIDHTYEAQEMNKAEALAHWQRHMGMK